LSSILLGWLLRPSRNQRHRCTRTLPLASNEIVVPSSFRIRGVGKGFGKFYGIEQREIGVTGFFISQGGRRLTSLNDS